ncbi:hypothetical protein COU59_00910 [Candidatus Pacearchaeota archaeon CG10_big_fil_rev_8_21_14_0_10_34_12]|nr:MAG: hypothetical protein COU59_00910 [Candidatus Pacearchaeota archaeon CG10_big_fil_rev_8_21_14_0_10_34_12]
MKKITKKNKKAVSGIIATVIMIGLVIGVTAIVWAVINNLIGKEISSSQSCFGNFGKVTLNKKYTCIDTALGEAHVSLSVGDVRIDSVLMAFSGASASKSFELKDGSNFSYVKSYSGSYSGTLSLPEKNSGITYIVDLSGLGVSDASSLKISPIIEGTQCEVSDSISELGSC